MLEKLLDKYIRDPLTRLAAPAAQIDVIRHRVASRLGARGQSALAVAGALALIGLGTVAANAAVPDQEPATSSTAAAGVDDQVLADRADGADRADRAERPEPSEPGPGEGEGAPQAAEPEQSPKPEPSPTEAEPAEQAESEPESQPEPAPQPAAPPPDWVHPMPGAATTSCFGMRGGVLHAGVDLAAPHGTPIRAVGAGTVTDAGWVFGGYGISVVIDHGNGFYTHYAHASQANVSPGQQVSPGQSIALEGSTGDSTGPHLHFEVHQGMWNQTEPTSWLRERGVNIGGC